MFVPLLLISTAYETLSARAVDDRRFVPHTLTRYMNISTEIRSMWTPIMAQGKTTGTALVIYALIMKLFAIVRVVDGWCGYPLSPHRFGESREIDGDRKVESYVVRTFVCSSAISDISEFRVSRQRPKNIMHIDTVAFYARTLSDWCDVRSVT